MDTLEQQMAEAVAHYWLTRKSQREKQIGRGISDAGLRSAVTGGAQMDGFMHLFTDLIVEAGIDIEDYESYLSKTYSRGRKRPVFLRRRIYTPCHYLAPLLES